MTCSICLEVLRDPVITPCGHVFCSQCLKTATERSADAVNAPCPSCRTSFSLMVPNKMFIPEKYWPFIDSNVRRVYFDGECGVSQERVAQLEARIMSLEGQKELLMDSCERHMLAADVHAEKETEARLQCDRLRKDLQTANLAIRKLAQRMKGDHASHATQRDKGTDCGNLLGNQQEQFTAHSRTREFFVEVPLPPSTRTTMLNDRIIKPSVPLPKRRRVSRAT